MIRQCHSRRCFIAGVGALALSAAAASAPEAAEDQKAAIEHLMMSTFDRPEQRLRVGPVVTGATHAVAGWSQGDMGGRALLRRSAQGWTIVLCAGDALTSAATLHQVGVPQAEAQTLAQSLAEAESALPPDRRAMFSRFEGLVRMDAGHPPAQPAGQGAHGRP